MKRSFLVWALFLGAWVGQPAISHGLAPSPVGTWEVSILGFDTGTSIMTFSNDFTVTGCGIMRHQFGFFTLAGNWSLDAHGGVIVSYLLSTNGVGSGGASFTARLLHSGRFRGSGHDDNGKLLHFKGEQPSNLPDLTGSWTAVVKRRGKTLLETYDITASTNFPAVFDVTGNGSSETAGSYTLTGTIIATPNNKLNASIDRTFGAETQHSSLAGRVKHKDSDMRLKGRDDTNVHLSIKAVNGS
ncbi:MAG: hypothetical protein ABSH14_00680 [Verrucomicrobiia bacterium]|jgi:hypothetical protein